MTGKEYNNQFSEEELEKEIWKDIPGWEGLYQVSDLGRVKSLERKVNGYPGTKRISYGRILLPAVRKRDGYVVVCFNRDKYSKMYPMQRLVLLSFVGLCPEGMEACHGPDFRPINNRLNNLRWDTDRNNQMDRIKSKTDNRGERNGQSKITKNDVIEIKQLHSTNNYTEEQLSNMFGVSKATIYDIVNGRTWAWL